MCIYIKKFRVVKQVKEITDSNNAAYGQPGAMEDLSREVFVR